MGFSGSCETTVCGVVFKVLYEEVTEEVRHPGGPAAHTVAGAEGYSALPTTLFRRRPPRQGELAEAPVSPVNLYAAVLSKCALVPWQAVLRV